MEQELFEGVKKGRRWALRNLCQENLKRSWFLCYQLAGDTAGGASLLIASWKSALETVSASKEPPSGDFETLLSWKILSNYEKGVEPKEEFEALPPPQVAKPYQPLVRHVGKLAPKYRPRYWLYAYGGLDASHMADATGEQLERVEEQLAQLEEYLAKRRAGWNRTDRAAYVRLNTQLRDVAGNGFQDVQMPEALLIALWKQVDLPVKPPKKRNKKPWSRKKQIAVGLAIGLGAILLAVGALLLALTLWKETGAAT